MPTIELPENTPAKTKFFARLLEKLSIGFAMAGGAIFIALVGMSVISIVGRKLFNSPIQGDLELMEIGAAIGAAAFLPLCALHGQNIRIEILTGNVSIYTKKILDTCAHALLVLVAGMLTWRTSLSVIDVKDAYEVSALLGFPLWIAVLLLVPSLALLTVNGVYQTYTTLTNSK